VVATRVPDVVDALVELAARTLDGWQVMDGPRAAEDPANDVLMVGVGNEENADPYRSSRDLPDLAGRPRETITVRCQASTWAGGTELGDLRRRLLEAMCDLDAAFTQTPALGGAANVRIGPARWYHLEGPDGAGVGVNFDVTAVAFL
jgi:hypothetical protein